MARTFHLGRIVVLAIVLVFSIVILGVSGHWESVTDELDLHVPFADMAIAISVLTIVTLLPMLVIDFLRSGAFTSFIVVEVVWFFVLAILWLATGALTSSNAAASILFSGGCHFFDDRNPALATAANDACQQWGALQAFEYINFIFLFVYAIALLVAAVIGANRGHHVWTNSVRESEFGGATAHPGGVDAPTHQSYPMQQTAPLTDGGSAIPMTVAHTQDYSGAAQV